MSGGIPGKFPEETTGRIYGRIFKKIEGIPEKISKKDERIPRRNSKAISGRVSKKPIKIYLKGEISGENHVV